MPAEEEKTIGFVEELARRLGGGGGEEEPRGLQRMSLEGTAHVGHRQLPAPELDQSPFELRALEVSLHMVRARCRPSNLGIKAENPHV